MERHLALAAQEKALSSRASRVAFVGPNASRMVSPCLQNGRGNVQYPDRLLVLTFVVVLSPFCSEGKMSLLIFWTMGTSENQWAGAGN